MIYSKGISIINLFTFKTLILITFSTTGRAKALDIIFFIEFVVIQLKQRI